MESLLVLIARGIIGFLRALPFRTAARVGRWGGGLAYWIDARHRRVALVNLTAVFGAEKSRAEIRELARENFRRIGEAYVCGLCTAGMTRAQLGEIMEVRGLEKILPKPGEPRGSRIAALGHFGHFELFAYLTELMPGYRCATTYRALRPPGLNQLLLSLREHSGCVFFERRSEAPALRAALSEGGVVLGLLNDQHGGKRGIVDQFLGHECSTSAATALLALRYRCPLFTAICYRTGLARWRIEVGDEIPTLENGEHREVAAIVRDINRALEVAVRRDPANWFWVHNRWRLVKRK